MGQKVWECLEKVRNVQKKFGKVQQFWKLFFSKLSENYKKNDVQLEARKSQKTRSNSKKRLESLVKSSEGRALIYTHSKYLKKQVVIL